jgi:rRNA maturation RNase YbeY
LKTNSLTDIVTFDMSEDKEKISGEIYISIERAEENAAKFRISVTEEIRRLIAHGILHLAGYGDKTMEEKKVMKHKEDYYLSLPAN